MENASILWLIQPAVALVIGLFVARKLRGFLRAIVIRLMPMRHRVSQNSYEIQTRFTTIAAFLTAIILAIAIDLGIRKTKRQLGWVTQSEMVTILPKPQPVAQTQPLTTASNEIPDELEIKIPPIVSQEKIIPPRPIHGGDWYLQVYAFSSLNKAIQQKNYWMNKTSLNARIGFAESQTAPYKVLIGPFYDRASAQDYLKEHKLTAFPRSMTSLQHYIE